jgi:aspartate aminotransferase
MVVDFARENDLWVISDEIYEGLVHDGEHQSPYSVDPQRVALISGLSKSFAMTGWRIGWTVCNPPLAAAMGRLQSQNSANACSVSQACIATALDQFDHPDLVSMYDCFRRRRDLLVEGLSDIPGTHFARPGGAFYLFLDVTERLGVDGVAADADAFALRLLEEKSVAVVPGGAFGSEGCIRISFARPDDELQQAIARIRDLLC